MVVGIWSCVIPVESLSKVTLLLSRMLVYKDNGVNVSEPAEAHIGNSYSIDIWLKWHPARDSSSGSHDVNAQSDVIHLWSVTLAVFIITHHVPLSLLSEIPWHLANGTRMTLIPMISPPHHFCKSGHAPAMVLIPPISSRHQNVPQPKVNGGKYFCNHQ
jgi:hypothetical protein